MVKRKLKKSKEDTEKDEFDLTILEKGAGSRLMTRQILNDRQEIRIALEGTEQPIPYSGEEREDGTKNSGYFSLLKDPSAIDKIPELFDEPIMKEFVRQIHVPDGIFETVRVHHFENTGENVEKVFLVGFVFRSREAFKNYQNCIRFAGNLLEQKYRDSRIHGVEFLVEIQPAIFRQEGAAGWIMDLWFSGFGKTPKEASDNLDTIFPVLIPLLTNGRGNQ